MRNANHLFLLSVLFFLMGACKQNSGPQDFSSVTKVNPWVSAYTSGTISKADPLTVIFTEAVVDQEDLGLVKKNKLLSFTPAIPGDLFWEDTRTLQFVPANFLTSSTTYRASLNVGRVIKDAKGEQAGFEFSFRTKDQHLSVETDILQAQDPTDLTRQELVGNIYTSDVVDLDALQKTVQATQNGDQLEIDWQLDEQRFVVQGIVRGETAGQVELNWDGAPINTKDRGVEIIEIPALGDFKVADVEVLHDPEQYLRIQFSDPILKRQDLSGLITIQGYSGELRYLVEGNEVRVFPAQRISGDYKVEVRSGIRNVARANMQEGGSWNLSFEEARPQVRLAGNGVILPNSESVIFPFEAIGLNAVELEVFKIFDNNILQFFQSNRLNGSYELNSVGRIIIQKKVDLNVLNPQASSHRWTRYGLDLSELFAEDPHAIYSVRLGFRPSYSTLPCGEGSQAAGTAQPMKTSASEEEFDRSIMDSWYGIEGYYDGYEWSNRDNPCFPEYYNSSRFVSRNVLASNLGIIAKMGSNRELTAIVTDLKSTDPVANTELQVFDFQQQQIGAGKTDGNGIARIALDREPFLILAKQGSEVGYLRLMDGDALSLSRFDVGGSQVQKGIKGFIYGERGVWRPGDSLFLNFVLDDRGNPLPEDYPLTFEIYDAQGQLFQRRTTDYHVDQVYPLHFGTPRDAPTGNWRAVVKVGGATFRKILKIETIKPNRIEIDLDLGEEELSGRDAVPVDLRARWLHGAPAGNLKARVEAQIQPVSTSFEDYPGFRFDDPARAYRDSRARTLFDGTLDDSGAASFSAPLLASQNVPGKMRVSLRTRVFEQGGDFSTDAFSVPYSPYQAYAGIEIPTNQYGEPRIDVDRAGNIRLVVVDENGEPLPNRQLSLGFYRVNWRWWWDQGEDYVSRYNTTLHNNAEKRTELRTDSNGEASWQVTPDRWGRYLIRVCDLDGGHCSGSYLYAGYPWNEDDDQGRELASMLNFQADKEKYLVGEDVTLTIPSAQAGRALVTLENGAQVVDRFWVEATAGEMEIKFKARADMTPTIYAHVSLIQEHGQMKNDLPIRLYGVIPISIEDPATRLEPQIAMPDKLKPEQTFTVEVSENNKKAMAYTLAVVDEGLLGLTRFQTPDPHDVFYAREALGVKTWDVYDNVLGAHGAELERLLSIGGDAEINRGELDNSANRFEPVVRHLGPFRLAAGKKNKHQISLPNYVGAVRVMVVASEKGAYGKADRRVPVSNPLMVLSTLPRLLSPGDAFTLPVNVFVSDAKVKNVQVQVKESSGLVKFQEPANKRVSFSSTGNQVVPFEVQVRDGVGTARFEVTASGNGESARQEIEVQVRNPNPYQTDVLAEVLDPGAIWDTRFAAIGMSGTNQAILELSSVPPLNLGRRLNYLLRYPYGCVEQTTSAAFPQLYVDRLIELSDEQKQKIPEHVREAVRRLRTFQTPNGGFAYWPGGNNPDQWSTNYAGHFLLEAKNQGYEVPASVLNKWIQFQKKAARIWNPKQADYGFYRASSQQLDQAYRLYTLALAGEPVLSAMNRLRESEDLQLQAKWRLAAAYALLGRDNVAEELTSGLQTEVEEYRELSYTYGSSIRDQAMILETTALLEQEDKAAQLVQDLSTALSQQGWLSTQTTAYALLAMAKYLGENRADEGLEFAYRYGGSATQRAQSNRPVFQVDLGLVEADNNDLRVENPTDKKLFARVVVSGQPKPGNELGISQDLQLEVRFTDLNGDQILPDRLEQGQDFLAEVRVTHPNSRLIRFEELALDQVFPAGWEIINRRMDDLQVSRQSPYDYQDIRDDQVNTFFSLRQGETKTYRVQLNAAYQGRFYLPAASCSAMYDNTINAFVPGRWVEVVQPGTL